MKCQPFFPTLSIFFEFSRFLSVCPSFTLILLLFVIRCTYGFFCTSHCFPIIPVAKEPYLFSSPLSFILVLLPKASSPHSILYNYIERVPGTKQSLPVPGTLLFKLSETIVFSQLLSKIGCSCSPLRAASTVSEILSKSAIRELGFKIALSCPKGTK